MIGVMSGTPFERVLVKYDWAQKHVNEVNTAIDLFRDSNPYPVGTKVNDETGQVTYFVENIPAIDDKIPLRFGDAIHNLRSTLDYLAQALVIKAGGTPDKHTAFPIYDTPEAYKSMSRGKIVGLRQQCLEVFDRIEPYKNGWGNQLWQLHQLDIIDKHRLLLAVCSMNTGRTATPSEVSQFSLKNRTIAAYGAVILPTQWVDPGYRFVPLYAGYELKTVSADEADQKMSFAFDVAINEPNVLAGAPAYLFLKSVSREILRIINEFGPFL